jgi:predicted nucleotidyltransferase
MLTKFDQLIPLLVTAQVEFIIVGGVAAVVHGSARSTEDLDIVYRRTPENVARLVDALAPLHPYPRGAPPGLPFRWEERTIWNGLNFTLATSLGAIDVLGEITGGGSYDDLLPYSERIHLFGVDCLCLGLERLIQVKRAAGRPRDFEAIAELEAILEERSSP